MGPSRVVALAIALVPLAACKGKEEKPPAAKEEAPAPEKAKPAATVRPDAPPLPPLAADSGDATGTFRWALPIGGLGSDVVHDLAVDAQGGAIVCGDFESEATFGELGKRKVAGKSDGYVLHVTADGKPD